MHLYDSHCHLDMLLDAQSAIDNARASGVSKLLSICTRYSKFIDCLKIAAKYDEVFLSFGLHPCNVEQETFLTYKEIIAISKTNKVIALGETGLDYYHKPFCKSVQTRNFIEHIKAAQELNIPVIVHTREAEEDTLAILKSQMAIKPFKAVIHCFTGTKKFAEGCLDIGCYISFSGIVTFKNANAVKEVASTIALNRMLIETDAPYLAPMPFRGKANEPAYVYHVAKYIAELRNVAINEIAEHTNANFEAIFGL